MTEEEAILEARFDPRLKEFWFLTTAAGLGVSIVGIFFLPFWLFGLGAWFCRESYQRLRCVLTSRTLVVRKGIFLRVEKTIALEKIQDMTLRQGPLLRYFGLSLLQVETAGLSTALGRSDSALLGMLDVVEFRQAVLRQRDGLAAERSREASASDHSPAPPEAGQAKGDLLAEIREIRDGLRRIEGLLAKRTESGG